MKSRFTPKSARALGALGLIAVLAACDEPPAPATLAEPPPAGVLAVATAALTSSVTIQRGTFGSVADATISANDMRKNYGTQKKLGVSWKDEALLRFDLSSIPAHAVIDRATLTVIVNGEEGRDDDDDDDDCHDDHDRRGSQGSPITLHRVTRAWSESTVTYANFAQRFDAAVTGVLVPSGRKAYKSVDVKSLVRDWVSGAQPNYGLIFDTTGRAKTLIVSSEQQKVQQRPALVVTYTVPTDHCAPNPCQNGGTCQNGASGYACECAAGYTGANCQTVIDVCSAAPCQNGGVCIGAVGSYTCNCVDGFSGQHCEVNINDCSPNPCLNGGVCTDGVATHTCACAPGYGGAECEIDINECANAPCQNGGTCSDAVNGFVCTCPTGYSGFTCTTNPDDCQNNVCQNNATCVDGLAAYTCSCAPGFDGDFCEHNIDDCAGAPCGEHGTCVDGAFAYTCACDAGFTGQNCEVDIDDCPAANPCNHGVCVDGINSHTCACDAYYTGATCDAEIFAASCAEILARNSDAASGTYTIDPLGNGQSTTAYCDMSTDGGGWTRIFGIENATDVFANRRPTNGLGLQAGLAAAASGTGHVVPSALATWRARFGELRFECRKNRMYHSFGGHPSHDFPGRQLHIKTSNAAVLDFFTNATSAYPSSLGSFTTLPDDNSVLSGFASDIVAEGPDIGQTKSGPNHWGFIFQYYSKTWGINGSAMSDSQFRNHTFFIRSTAHWLLDGNNYECDDEDRTYAGPTAPMGHWFIYAR